MLCWWQNEGTWWARISYRQHNGKLMAHIFYMPSRYYQLIIIKFRIHVRATFHTYWGSILSLICRHLLRLTATWHLKLIWLSRYMYIIKMYIIKSIHLLIKNFPTMRKLKKIFFKFFITTTRFHSKFSISLP